MENGVLVPLVMSSTAIRIKSEEQIHTGNGFEAQIHTGNGFGAFGKERPEPAPLVMSSAVVRTGRIGTGTFSNVMYRKTIGSERKREGEA